MKPPREPELELRGRLIRSLGSLREMLPGSFVERQRACGRPNCHCADGKLLHSQYQISVLIDGKPKALNVPTKLADEVREKIELRRRFAAAAATICEVNLKGVSRTEGRPPGGSRHRLETDPDKVFGFSGLVAALPEGRQS